MSAPRSSAPTPDDVAASLFADPRRFLHDPAPLEAALAAGTGVHRVRRLGLTIIGGYDCVMLAARDAETFPPNLRPMDSLEDQLAEGAFLRVLRNSGEAHRQARRLMVDAAQLANIALLTDLVDRRCDQFMSACPLDDVFDLGEPAQALTCGIIAQLVGLSTQPDDPVPEGGVFPFFRAVERRLGGMGSRAYQQAATDTLPRLYAYLRALLARRRLVPQADMLSRLLATGLSEGGIISLVRQVMAGGAGTVRSQILNIALLMAERPDVWQRLRAAPACLPTFLTEAVRLTAAVAGMFRRVAHETTLHGCPLAAGEFVQIRYRSPGFDPGRFPDPLSFRWHRPDKPRHFAFGYGPHNCPGKDLALMTLNAVFARLLDRVDRFVCPVARKDLPWVRDLSSHALETLPIQLQSGG